MKQPRNKTRRSSLKTVTPSERAPGVLPAPVANDSRTHELVRAILMKHRELRSASEELQRLGSFLYIDKFRFAPSISLAVRWYLHHRLRASLEEEAEHPVLQGRNVIVFGSHVAVPNETLDLVQEFIAES